MSAYYNEHDPFAAAWLRNLISDRLIAPGEVDERSIVDVRPDEIQGFDQHHFFAGIGVWSYALRRAGWGDERQVWTGSCPCQPFSAAGSKRGFTDERHLWPEFFRLIRQCRPDVVFGEQVSSHDGLAWFDVVSADLEGSGYACGAQSELAAKVETLADYEFSRVNILSIQRDLSKQTIASIEETILKQFDDLSRKHSWDKDSDNVHYFNGWCTNKSWKINDRVVLPYYRAWDTTWGRWSFDNKAGELIDLEKCLTFLNGGLPPDVKISQAIHRAQEVGQSSGIEAGFFSVTFYKKGTCHIRFTRKDLLDRLNRFGAQKKQWLPPSYGRRSYADMNETERAVVDSFEGEATYAKVMADPAKYIVETAGMLQIAGT